MSLMPWQQSSRTRSRFVTNSDLTHYRTWSSFSLSQAKNEVTLEETEIFEAENAELLRELAELTSKPDPLIHLTQTHNEFRQDYQKFEQFIATLQAQVELFIVALIFLAM